MLTFTYLFTLQRDVLVSLKAHIPTGFIYVAKMTHIFVPGSMSRVYIPVGLRTK